MNLPENKLMVPLLPKQMAFLESGKKEKLLSGAFGAGKSRVLCYDAARHARHEGNLVGLCRKTLTSLRETTLRVLLKPDGHLPPVLPEGTYEHNKSEHLIRLHGGGEIYYFGFDDPLRIASLNLGYVAVDEGIELDEDEYIMLLGRLRNMADPCRQIGTATNPGAPSHFLHKRFFEESDDDRLLLQTTSEENYLLPADYIKSLNKLTGQYKDRFVLGKWVAFEGLIYDNFSREIHVRHRDASEFKWLMITVDEGYEDPAVLMLWGVDSDRRMHLFKMFYRNHVLQDRLVGIMRVFGMSLTPAMLPPDPKLAAKIWQPLDRTFVIDPSAAGLRAAAEAAGLHCEKADNAVFDGIQETRNRLAVAGDGLPRLTVEPDCEGLGKFLTEMESYHLGKDEKPVKGLDHAMDGTRYGAMHLRTPSAPTVHSLEVENKHDMDETREELGERLSERAEIWV